MCNSPTWVAVLLSFTLLACSDSSPSTVPRAETPASVPAAEAAIGAFDPARALAGRVNEAGGGFVGEQGLSFRFVVVVDGERVFAASHRWDAPGHRDLVEWTGRDGRARRARVDLETRRACGSIDGEAVAAGVELDALSEQAYGRFINDSYWLLMPQKLFDPGVTLVLEEARERDGKRYEILRMSFGEEIGLTPGDVYWLFVDPDSAHIERWEMQLEGQQEPPEGTSWTDYQRVGELMLARDHVSDDGSQRILFEEVATLDSPADFDVEGCPAEAEI